MLGLVPLPGGRAQHQRTWSQPATSAPFDPSGAPSWPVRSKLESAELEASRDGSISRPVRSKPLSGNGTTASWLDGTSLLLLLVHRLSSEAASVKTLPAAEQECTSKRPQTKRSSRRSAHRWIDESGQESRVIILLASSRRFTLGFIGGGGLIEQNWIPQQRRSVSRHWNTTRPFAVRCEHASRQATSLCELQAGA